MSQTSIIAAGLLIGFLVFITIRGELGSPGTANTYRDVIGI